MFIMSKIYKFPKSKRNYSETFINNVKPDVIGDFIKDQHPHLTVRAADAMALAMIYSTYLDLVINEENISKYPSIKDIEEYIWVAHDKKKLH